MEDTDKWFLSLNTFIFIDKFLYIIVLERAEYFNNIYELYELPPDYTKNRNSYQNILKQ